jgi:hypothetical protein
MGRVGCRVGPMKQHGMQIYGVLLMDRDLGRVNALHNECAKVVYRIAMDNGISIMARFTEMGPASADPSRTCDLTSCGKPLGESGNPS